MRKAGLVLELLSLYISIIYICIYIYLSLSFSLHLFSLISFDPSAPELVCLPGPMGISLVSESGICRAFCGISPFWGGGGMVVSLLGHADSGAAEPILKAPGLASIVVVVVVVA